MSDTDTKGDQAGTNGAPAADNGPSGFLSEIIGAPVTVKLNSGVTYKGRLDFARNNDYTSLGH